MQRLKPYLTYLMRGMGNLPAVVARVFRGIVVEKYQAGSEVHWSAFTSTTINLIKAKNFAEGTGGIICRIDVLYGR